MNRYTIITANGLTISEFADSLGDVMSLLAGRGIREDQLQAVQFHRRVSSRRRKK